MTIFTIPRGNYNLRIEKVNDISDFPEHCHDYIEIFIVASGTGIHILNGKEYKLECGDILIVSPDSVHGFKELINPIIYNVGFTFELLYSYYPEVKEIPGFHSLFITGNSEKHKIHLGNKLLLKCIELLESMYNENIKKDYGYEVMCRTSFANLIVYLSRKQTEQSKLSSDPERYLLSKSVSFMEQNHNKNISINELSEIANISSRHYSRLFKKYYGITPLQYLIDLRLNNAAGMMLTTNKSITEIALECGFYDSSSFCRQFKAHFNIRASDFRRLTHSN